VYVPEEIEQEEGMDMKKIIISTAVCLALGASQAFAGKLDNPAYVGAGGSYVHYDTGVSTTGDLDEDDWGWKVFGGYRFHENFSLEAFYADFGEAELDLNTGDTLEGMVATAPIDMDVSAKSFGAAAVLLFPVSDEFDLYGKLGVHRWDLDASANSAGITYDEDDDGVDAFVGLGASFAPTEDVSIRLEYERYFFDGDDLDAATLGVALHF
jgi:OOP family OmpA-OmpF porin